MKDNKDNLDILYIPNFFSESECKLIINRLKEEVKLEEKTIIKNSISYKQKRLVAWYSEQNINSTFYSYTDVSKQWTPILVNIKNKLEGELKAIFNGVLVNYYKDGLDEIGWHSDDTDELGNNPYIASVSFGASRIFKMRHKFDKEIEIQDFLLENGSLMIMKGNTQLYWEHSLPIDVECNSERINLTFRYIKI